MPGLRGAIPSLHGRLAAIVSIMSQLLMLFSRCLTPFRCHEMWSHMTDLETMLQLEHSCALPLDLRRFPFRIDSNEYSARQGFGDVLTCSEPAWRRHNQNSLFRNPASSRKEGRRRTDRMGQWPKEQADVVSTAARWNRRIPAFRFEL
jgi:hypothetical protein